ncbi:MAG TPA: type III-B CRISPR module-associated protein Cmr5 [Chthonomonadales bacterium]|nr:type III-B CRISPR module-associated protein Cmr5 [Chthonomonadales bacterium]
MKTRAQEDMKKAAERVAEVKGKEWADRYGALCHSFPIMVRTCGLCQAVAFSEAKAKDDNHRAEAHRRILSDVKAITGKTPEQIAALPVVDYMLQTRRLLSAWIYYKRFAESILNAKPGDQNDV